MTAKYYDDAIHARAESPTARYRAMSREAVLCLTLGILSVVVFLDWALVFIPLTAMLFGWLAKRRIRRAPEEWTGRRLIHWGVALAVVFWIAGYGYLSYYYWVGEVPWGYQRVDYKQLQPDPSVAGQRVPDSVMAMNNKKVFIKAYIMPTRQLMRLKQFYVCPTNGTCQYCTPNPAPTEIIRIKMTGDLSTDYTTRLIGLGGTLHVNPNFGPRELPYSLDVDVLR